MRKIPKRIEIMIRDIKTLLMVKKYVQMFKMEEKKLYIEMSKIILLLVSFGLPYFVDMLCWSIVRYGLVKLIGDWLL